MCIAIEDIALGTSGYCISLETLAMHNSIDRNKYLVGIGQKNFSITPPDEDIITLAYKAASQIITKDNVKNIKFLFFATESSFDNSKSAGAYLHELLQLPEDCRIIELKQACYGGTAALLLAKSFLETTGDKNAKCLVITSDIAKYELMSNAEPTQGAASVAMLLSKENDNAIASLEHFGGTVTKNSNDFSKPNYMRYPFVNGKLSIVIYLSFLKQSIKKFLSEFNLGIEDFSAICYHTPFPKMAYKANDMIQKLYPELSSGRYISDIKEQVYYNSEIGNSYTASLYLSLLSLLEQDYNDFTNKRIGMFSYGSGSTCELFTIIISEHYKQKLRKEFNLKLIQNRKFSDYEEYKFFHDFTYTNDTEIPVFSDSVIRLKSIKNHVRNYEFL